MDDDYPLARTVLRAALPVEFEHVLVVGIPAGRQELYVAYSLPDEAAALKLLEAGRAYLKRKTK